MVCVKRAPELDPAMGAPPAAHEGQDQSLPGGEEPSHWLIRYSVNMISRIGRLAGGFNTAC
jgi:hypothetical protein